MYKISLGFCQESPPGWKIVYELVSQVSPQNCHPQLTGPPLFTQVIYYHFKRWNTWTGVGVAVGLPPPASWAWPALPGRGTVAGPLGKVPSATASNGTGWPGLPVRPGAINWGNWQFWMDWFIKSCIVLAPFLIGKFLNQQDSLEMRTSFEVGSVKPKKGLGSK